MKIKGITFWEQHVERVVILLALVVAGGLTFMQFVGDPNAVEVAGQRVTPADVDDLLQDKAQALATKLSPDAASPMDEESPEPMLEQFTESLAMSITPQPKLAVLQPRIGLAAGGTLPPAGSPFVVAQVPAPTDVIHRQYYDTLTADIVVEFPELKEIVQAEPFDLTWITPAAKLNLAQIRQQFATDDPDGTRALPAKWYNDRVDVIDVVVEREELVDGGWTRSVVLEPIPGQWSFRPYLKEKIDTATRDQILAASADPSYRNEVIQPQFYPTEAGNWIPPEWGREIVDPEELEAAEEEQKIHYLEEGLKAERRIREDILAKIEENNCPKDEPPPATGGRGGSPRGGGAGAAPGTGAGDVSGGKGLGAPGGATAEPNKLLCKRLKNQLAKVNNRISGIEAELGRLNVAPPVEEEVQPELVEEMPDEITIWAHDMTVKPGSTYRYRFIAKVYNPLYARKLDLIDAQKPLAEQFTLDSQPSEWSEPITTEPPLQLFVTNAGGTTGGPLRGPAMGTARAEVYRFQNGRWWMETFSVQPGDRVGVGKGNLARDGQDVSFETDWFLLDVVEVSSADSSQEETYQVILQSIDDLALTQIRLPAKDKYDPERKTLRQRVELARLEESVASSQ